MQFICSNKLKMFFLKTHHFQNSENVSRYEQTAQLYSRLLFIVLKLSNDTARCDKNDQISREECKAYRENRNGAAEKVAEIVANETSCEFRRNS